MELYICNRFPMVPYTKPRPFIPRMAQASNLPTMPGCVPGVITGRKSSAVERRAKEVGMEFVFQGCAEKIPAYEEILRRAAVTDDEVAYIGDDLPDLPVMQRAGLAIAVANGVAEVRAAAHYVTQRAGGDAGVREAIEGILKAQKKWESVSRNARA